MMYSKILVPLDGSQFSQGVLPYVRSLARSLKTPVELLHVNDPARLAPFSPPLAGGEYLQGVAASLSGAGEVQCRVEIGEAAGIIVDLAATQAGTLIAMTTHGYSATQRWLLGSVADKVLHGSTSHLLLVRPARGDTGGAASLTTILVPLDGSGLAENALPIATELASRLNLKVVLVRVLQHLNVAPPDAFLPLFGSSAAKQKEIWAQARSAVDEYLATKVDEMRSQGLSQVSSMSIESTAGGAAAEIIDLARKTTDNLVVMSTHGRSGIGRWLLGSVTERVVRHAEDPVLVLRPFDFAHGSQTLTGP
jgi:nucleotide-binding universal stress UspA family protein